MSRGENRSRWTCWVWGWLLITVSVLASGCIHLAPRPYGAQREEAKLLAKQLRQLNSAARQVVMLEHQLARELRVVLDELGKLPESDFQRRFNDFSTGLISIQTQRRDLLVKFDGRNWESAMVQVMQQGVVQQLKVDLARTQRWIELTEGVRLRVELGRTEGFPELNMLSHQLDIFLAGRADLDPFQGRIQALQDAFRLKNQDMK